MDGCEKLFRKWYISYSTATSAGAVRAYKSATVHMEQMPYLRERDRDPHSTGKELDRIALLKASEEQII